MDEGIQFAGKYKEWVSVKKMEITDDKKNTDVATFLASLSETLERKTEDFLKQSLDLSDLDKAIENIVPGEFKNEADFAVALKALKSPKITKLINEAIKKAGITGITKNEKKLINALKALGKAYAIRKALQRAKWSVNYNDIIYDAYNEKRGDIITPLK